MFDSSCGDEEFADLLHLFGAASHYEDFQAIMLIKVNVQGRNDQLMLSVLNLRELLG